MKKEISESFVIDCKNKRKKRGMTQREVAKKLGWSLSKYQRLEAFNSKHIGEEEIISLCDFFEIDVAYAVNDSRKNINTRVRLPKKIYDNIKLIQSSKELDTFTEAIIFCLNDYFNNLDLAKQKYEIMEYLEEIILATYSKDLKNIYGDVKKSKHILNYLSDKYGFNIEDEISELEYMDKKKLNAKV